MQRFLLGLLLLIIGYLLLALILSLVSISPEKIDCEQRRQIFIATNGIHLEIIIPSDVVEAKFDAELGLRPHTSYVSFGWGDKAFYLDTPNWSDLKISTAFKAMFLNSSTAIHLTEYIWQYHKWEKLLLCEEQLEALLDYISQSFTRDEEGRIIEIPGAGYGSYDRFYEAKGNYNVINTCNIWVNSGLKKAKIKTAVWSPFDKGVLYQIKKQD